MFEAGTGNRVFISTPIAIESSQTVSIVNNTTRSQSLELVCVQVNPIQWNSLFASDVLIYD
jgi:hypothetical protein